MGFRRARRSTSPWSGASSNDTLINSGSEDGGGRRPRRRGPCAQCRDQRKRCFFLHPGAQICANCERSGYECRILGRPPSWRSRGRPRSGFTIQEEEEPEDIAENYRVLEALAEELELRLSGNMDTSMRSEEELRQLIAQARSITSRARFSGNAATVQRSRPMEDETFGGNIVRMENLGPMGEDWISGALPMTPLRNPESQQNYTSYRSSPYQPPNLPIMFEADEDNPD